MGFISILKAKGAEYQKSAAERRGYQRIVAEKTKLAARQAYADEAVKVARERARAKARAPSFGQQIGMFAQRVAQP